MRLGKIFKVPHHDLDRMMQQELHDSPSHSND
jgi:hypothetical protein